MKLHTLKPAPGSVHSKKRVGRGEGSGYGVTSGKGNKGQQSRTGYSAKRGHEGGQMPIQRRMPKRGFKNPFRIDYKVFNLGQIDYLVETYQMSAFDIDNLLLNNLIKATDAVKVLGAGEIKTKVDVKVNAISQKAKEAIEALGGKVEFE